MLNETILFLLFERGTITLMQEPLILALGLYAYHHQASLQLAIEELKVVIQAKASTLQSNRTREISDLLDAVYRLDDRFRTFGSDTTCFPYRTIAAQPITPQGSAEHLALIPLVSRTCVSSMY